MCRACITQCNVDSLETLDLLADLELRVRMAMRVRGRGVDFQEVVSLSPDHVLTLWKRCACQRILC